MRITLTISVIFNHTYPIFIPKFDVRLDVHTGKLVETGLMDEIGGVPNDLCRLQHYRRNINTKYSMEEFKKRLKCSIDEPDLDEHTGTMSMLRTLPVNRETLLLMSVWGEKRCQPWVICQKLLNEEYKEKKYPNEVPMRRYGYFQKFRLTRIINSTVYEDWPFDMKRLDPEDRSNADQRRWFDRQYALLEVVSAKVKDLKDSVFFMGREEVFMPWNFPFPTFCSGARLEYNHMPWPWGPSVREEWILYTKILTHQNGNFSEASYAKITNQLPWKERHYQAAYYGTWSTIRHFAYEAMRLHPAQVTGAMTLLPFQVIDPWNPTSKESKLGLDTLGKMTESEKTQAESLPPGYAKPLGKFITKATYHPGHYKYVVVMLARDGKSTSGRLADLLAHSGAVILLQESPFRWHFSARLQPWVHYVPVSYSAADLARKVAWLQSHDKEAQQLAENARNFGRSYLRLEDYLCYAAHAMEAVAEVVLPDALIPDEPYMLSNKECYNE